MGFLTPSTKKITPILFWKTIGWTILWSFLTVILLVAFAFSTPYVRFKISESIFLYFLGFEFVGVGIWSVKSKVYGGVDLDAGQYFLSKIFGWKNMTPAYFGKKAVTLGIINILGGIVMIFLGLATTYFSKNYNWITINIGDILYRNPFSSSLVYRFFWVFIIGLMLIVVVYQVHTTTNIAKAPIKWLAAIFKVLILSIFILIFYFYINYSKCQLTDIFGKTATVTGIIKYDGEQKSNKCDWYRFNNRNNVSVVTLSGRVESIYLPVSMNRALKEGWMIEAVYTPVFHVANTVTIIDN